MDTPPATPSPSRRRIVQDYLVPLAVWLAVGVGVVGVIEACVVLYLPGAMWPDGPLGFLWVYVGVAAAPVFPFLYGPPASDWWCQRATWGVVDAVSLVLFVWILFSRSPRKTLWLALHGLIWWTLAAAFAFCYIVASC